MCIANLIRLRRSLGRCAFVAMAFVLAVAAGASAADKTTAPKSPEKPAAPKAPGKKSDGKSDEAAIRAAAKAFVEAFNRGDAKAVAALWTANGSLADDSGQVLKGRKAIENEYAALFKQHAGARMEVSVQSIHFPTAAMAVEDGTAQVALKDGGSPAASRYTAVHVLEGGKWLMAAVRESGVPLASAFPRLQDLGWLIGRWEAKHDGTTVHSDFRWIANRSFIQRDYTVRREGVVASSGTQVIGFDPQAGRIRSWSFDSTGGHGTGLWSPAPEGWLIESSGTLADGTPTSSRELLLRVAGENNVLGWRSFDRRAGEVTLPDTAEVVLDRVPEKK